MDVTALHAATEELAGYFSELTVSDLRRPTERYRRGIGELIERLMAEDVWLATDLRQQLRGAGGPAEPAEQPSTEPSPQPSEAAVAEADLRIASKVAAPDLFGGGFESGYRRTAGMVEAAFNSAPAPAADLVDRYWQRVIDLRRHIHDVATALDLRDEDPHH